jgi:hypothetical protein
VRRSAWDTFDSAGLGTSGATGMHAGSTAVHLVVRINQYEVIVSRNDGALVQAISK